MYLGFSYGLWFRILDICFGIDYLNSMAGDLGSVKIVFFVCTRLLKL